MNEHNWNREYPERPEPWEQNFYQTGSTKPPKTRRGLIAMLLVLVIFLGGIVSALGLLNVQLFRRLKDLQTEEEASFQFSDESKTPTVSTGETEDAPVTSDTGSKLQLQLNQTPAAIANIPQSGGLSLQEIYNKAKASVVSISCISREGSFSGTGVVLSSDGYIVTNCHVVEDAEAIEVIFHDQSSLDASLVGLDVVSDLAVLYVQATDLVAAEFGDSSNLQVGDLAVAIGDPLGIALRGTMTDGIVSAINRDITTGGRTMTLIQTNAALNSGNSGGPLLNCFGQVVGINTMKIGDHMNSAGVEGLGFAIPSTTVKEIVDQLIDQGYVSGRPTLGMTFEEISSFYQLYYRIPQGLYITQVAQDSDAAAKGIVTGDILLQVDNTRITSEDTLETLLYSHKAGDTVTVYLYRAGKQFSVTLTLGESQ